MKKNHTGKLFRTESNKVYHQRFVNYPGILLITLFLFLSACTPGSKQSDEGGSTAEEKQEEQDDAKTARAEMEAASGSKVTGEANFTEEDGKVLFDLSVENLTPGDHAVHLHEKGDCTAEDASSAGGHWNPTMKPHGKRGDRGSFHKGDIANMSVGNDGKGTLRLSIEGWTIGGADSTNVLGKSVIVHEKADDFTTQPSGNAGARLSCGVIKAE